MYLHCRAIRVDNNISLEAFGGTDTSKLIQAKHVLHIMNEKRCGVM